MFFLLQVYNSKANTTLQFLLLSALCCQVTIVASSYLKRTGRFQTHKKLCFVLLGKCFHYRNYIIDILFFTTASRDISHYFVLGVIWCLPLSFCILSNIAFVNEHDRLHSGNQAIEKIGFDIGDGVRKDWFIPKECLQFWPFISVNLGLLMTYVVFYYMSMRISAAPRIAHKYTEDQEI